jgi:CTP:molybdopterin cytidylyltransferase MocA
MMSSSIERQFPVFVMCGRDPIRRRVMEVLDSEGHYAVKALLPFLGKRIIDWQLEALAASPYVSDIYLLGLCEELATFDLPIEYIPTEVTADFSEKLIQGLAYLGKKGRDPSMIVISSSDAPAVMKEHVDLFLSHLSVLQDYDFVLSVVPEAIAEKAFPRSGRVVARFRDHQVFPGELYALSKRAITQGHTIISELNKRRRMINRQARKISLGPVVQLIARRPQTWPLLMKFLLGRATLEDGERAVSLAFTCKTKTVLIEDAGFGMDIDLPEDYMRLQQYMQTRMQIERLEA